MISIYQKVKEQLIIRNELYNDKDFMMKVGEFIELLEANPDLKEKQIESIKEDRISFSNEVSNNLGRKIKFLTVFKRGWVKESLVGSPDSHTYCGSAIYDEGSE